MLRGVEAGVLNPIAGFLVDRIPARRLMLLGVLLSSGGLLLLGSARNLGMFYGSFVIITLGTTLTINVVPATVIVRWFRRQVGRAASLFAVGMGLGGLMVPVTTMMIERFGWQTAIQILAGVCLLVGIPLVLVFRDHPADMGLLPDGQPPTDTTPVLEPPSLTVAQALHRRAFWQSGVAIMCFVAGIAAYVMYAMPYLETNGVSRQMASVIAMAVPLASLPARIGLGWLADRYSKKNVTAMAIALSGLGLLLFASISYNPPVLIVLYVIVLATGMGGLTPLPPPLMREHFGTRRFGSIFGLSGIFITVGAVSAPLLVGMTVDRIGGYGVSWWALGALAFVGAAVMYTMPRPPAAVPLATTRPGIVLQ